MPVEVVAFGGGHGLSRLLKALHSLGARLAGIVATTDDGGSTGRLRREWGGIAWGDIRNCLNHLVEQPTVGSLLFEYRFTEGSELKGHNLGNLLLIALSNLCSRPYDAVELMRNMLQVDVRLIPMTEQAANLVAVSKSGARIEGECAIAELPDLVRSVAVEPEAIEATPEAIEAIQTAKAILLGPGSFLTSVMPGLLVPTLREAVLTSTAPRILIIGVAKEAGPMQSATVEDKLELLWRSLSDKRLDVVVWPKERGPIPSILRNISTTIIEENFAEEPGSRLHDVEVLRRVLNEELGRSGVTPRA